MNFTVKDTVAEAEALYLQDGDFVFVKSRKCLYCYDSSSTETRNSQDILNIASGTGRLLAVNRGLSVPIGTILPFAQGYFGAAANGGGWTNYGTNTVAGVNAWLAANGYSNFCVCDGTAKNDSDSLIYTGANRYLPDLTDSRFLRGSTTAGGAGASSGAIAGESAHTHSTPTHSHSLSGDTAWAQFYQLSGNWHIRTITATSWAAARTGSLAGAGGGAGHTTGTAIAGATSVDGSGTTGPGSSHTHTVSAVEPKYFSCYYVIRYK
jgi:hypothetical protein